MKKLLIRLAAAVALVATGVTSQAAFVAGFLQTPSGAAITAANVAAFPAFTTGSYVSLYGGTSGGTLEIDTVGTTWVETLHVYVAVGGFGTTFLAQVPDASIYRLSTGTFGAIASGAQDVYFVNIPAGTPYVAASAFTSGSVFVKLTSLPWATDFPGATGSAGSSTTKPTSGAATSANPTIANATSVQLVAAGTYNYIEIQNNLSSSLVISISGATITSLTPGASNNVVIIPPGGEWHSPPNWTPTTAITGYQTSGGSTNLVTVVTG